MLRTASRLDLKITDLAAKRRWLDILDTMLRDARVLEDAQWDLRRMRYAVDLERIGYGAHTIFEAQERVFEYPTVACRLIISPVISCVDGRDVAEVEDGSGEILQALQLRDRRELALVSNYGTSRLQLGEDPSIFIKDIGAPNHERVIADYGKAGIDLHAAEELLRSRHL